MSRPSATAVKAEEPVKPEAPSTVENGVSRRRLVSFPLMTKLLGIGVALLVIVPLVLVVFKLIIPDWQLNTGAFSSVFNQNGLLEMLRNTVVVIVLGTTGAVIVG